LRAPSYPVITIDRIKDVVGKTAEFTLVRNNVTRSGFLIVTNVGAKLYYRELLGSNSPNNVVLVEPTDQDELARIKRIEGKWLTGAIAQK